MGVVCVTQSVVIATSLMDSLVVFCHGMVVVSSSFVMLQHLRCSLFSEGQIYGHRVAPNVCCSKNSLLGDSICLQALAALNTFHLHGFAAKVYVPATQILQVQPRFCSGWWQG